MSWHRHAYPVAGPGGTPPLSDCAYRDGHPGPCDSPHAVVVLDPRDMDTLRPLQEALDAHREHPGIQSLKHAVESLLSERVS